MNSADRNALRAWLELLLTAKAIKKSLDTALRREFGISLARFDILAALYRAGQQGLRAGDLSQKLMVTDGNTTQVAAPLIKERLVRRVASKSDGRVVIMQLTQQGERRFKQMADAHQAWIEEAFGELSDGDIADLRRLIAGLDSQIDDVKNARSAA